MFEFIVNNLSTILVGSGTAAVLVGIALKILRDKRKGKSSCGSSCAGCPSAGMCHPK